MEEELQWLENLELIFWEQYYKNKEKRETRKNQMKTLLKGGTLKKATRNQTCCEAYFTLCNVHSFIGDLAVSGVRFGEREKALLRELVFRCAQLEEEDNTLLSINTLVICMSYKFTPEELRLFFKSLVVEVASMSPRWKKKAVNRVQHQLAYSGI